MVPVTPPLSIALYPQKVLTKGPLSQSHYLPNQEYWKEGSSRDWVWGKGASCYKCSYLGHLFNRLESSFSGMSEWSRSVVSISVIPCTVASQALLSMEFSQQAYWSGLPFPSPGDLPNSGILHCKQILEQLTLQGSLASLLLFKLRVLFVCLLSYLKPVTPGLSREDPLEREMVTHSSILAWEIPWIEEPDGLQSKGCERVGHEWACQALKTV